MRRRTRKMLPNIIAACLVLTVFISGFGTLIVSSFGVAVADEFGCFDTASQYQTVIVVDASAPRWNREQGRSLRTYMDRLYEHLRFNERLSVFTTEGDQIASVVSARFTVCGQATHPDQLAQIGAGQAQAGYLERQTQRLYDDLLTPELNALLTLTPDESRLQLNESPVLETIRSVSRATLLQPGDRMVVISDMVQNSESARFCKVRGDMPSFDVFKNRLVYQDRLIPESLDGVRVEALMLMRGGYGQFGPYCPGGEEEVRGFWRGYFSQNGASEVQFTRIRLGSGDQ